MIDVAVEAWKLSDVVFYGIATEPLRLDVVPALSTFVRRVVHGLFIPPTCASRLHKYLGKHRPSTAF